VTGGGTASCTGTPTVTSTIGAPTIGQYSCLVNPGSGADPALALNCSLSGTGQVGAYGWTGGSAQFLSGGTATSGANINPPSALYQGQAWNGSASSNDRWSFTPTLATGTNPTSTFTISHSGPGTGVLALPAGTTVGGSPIGTATRNIVTLASGTATVTNSAACTPSSTCTYKLTNCGPNSSVGIGTPSVGTVVSGTSFVINSLSPTNTVLTTDASSICWQIN
jgi:hypothetical protein